jgi:hypothetical protein
LFEQFQIAELVRLTRGPPLRLAYAQMFQFWRRLTN